MVNFVKTNWLMGKYLDPKYDLTFKAVFAEHPDHIISFLNALLPFKEGRKWLISNICHRSWFPTAR